MRKSYLLIATAMLFGSLQGTAQSWPTTMITDIPAGTLIKNAYGSSHGYSNDYYYNAVEKRVDGSAVDMVDAGDYFYIKNPISQTVTNSWLKGAKHKSGVDGVPDTIVCDLPQLMQIDNFDDAYYAQALELSYYGGFTASAQKQVKFTWDGTSLVKLDQSVILGLADQDLEYDVMGDDSIVVHTLADVPTALPEGATTQDCAFRYRGASGGTVLTRAKLARVGDELFVGGVVPKQYLWIKGTIKDDKVTFLPQYMGVDTTSAVHKYFEPAKVDSLASNYGLYTLTAQFAPQLVFDFDASTLQLSTSGDFLVNIGNKVPSTLYYFPESQFAPYASGEVSLPAPEIVEGTAYSASTGKGSLKFNLVPLDASGNDLDPNSFYYRAYVDGNPYTFTTDVYTKLKQDMTYIPYSFDDWQDLRCYNNSHTTYFRTPFTCVGVQAVYKSGDVESASEIAWWPQAPSGVDGIANGHGTPLRVTYTDLSGRQLSQQPSSGVCIMTAHYGDGSTVTTKVVK